MTDNDPAVARIRALEEAMATLKERLRGVEDANDTIHDGIANDVKVIKLSMGLVAFIVTAVHLIDFVRTVGKFVP